MAADPGAGRRGRLAFPAAALILSVLSSCAVLSKQQLAQRVISSEKRVWATGTATGTLTETLQPVRIGAAAAMSGAPKVSAPPAITLPASSLELDFGHRSAAVVPTDYLGSQGGTSKSASPGLASAFRGRGVLPALVFNKWLVFLHKPAAGGGDARNWFELDYSGLKRNDTSRISSPSPLDVINPTLLVQLIGGVLTGSVREVGVEDVDGVRTTHYTANIDRSKAAQKMSDKDKETIARLFASDDISGSVYNGAGIWLDSAGLPRRFTLPLRQKVTADEVFKLTYTIDLGGFGQAVHIAPPGVDQLSQVNTLAQLIASASA